MKHFHSECSCSNGVYVAVSAEFPVNGDPQNIDGGVLSDGDVKECQRWAVLLDIIMARCFCSVTAIGTCEDCLHLHACRHGLFNL